ncbi:hypothetical protein [Clostridium botulinum]|uniref:hypothetical protein n=1 Tax=Clostridium botulinum TaxID=1491 RepID=UPI000B0DC195|nr:hypothetical protein [Clostridium botulinum]
MKNIYKRKAWLLYDGILLEGYTSKRRFIPNNKGCGFSYQEIRKKDIGKILFYNKLQDRIWEEATQSFEIGTIEEAKPYKFITEIVTEMNNAINKYGVDKVELLLLEEEEIFYIHYHDKHDSHPIGDTYSISDYDIVDIEQLEKLCNENNFDFDRM